MINFPATAGQPTDGSFTHSEVGLTWTWNGTTWDVEGGGGAAGPDGCYVGDTPPVGAEPGWLWWNSAEGILYVWYDDGDTQQWVEASPQGVGGSYVAKAGDTMTGNLTVPSLNGGQLAGFRNVLINGNLAINQRNVTIAAAAVGAYGPDRWKKVDASSMTQIVEEGNFAPSAVYTLSGSGVTTQQLTAPASGNWTLPNIPITATNIQLEPGTVATPFELRPVGVELHLAQRYYQRRSGYFESCKASPAVTRSGSVFVFTTQSMRSVPTVTFYDLAGAAGKITTTVETSNYNGQSITGVTADRDGVNLYRLDANNISSLIVGRVDFSIEL
jgi:hypothetical protein